MAEVRSIHEKALADLLRAMDRGAIAEEGRRWIPGTPGKTSGSRWGVLYAAFPCRTLPPDHELIIGTIWKIERRISAGGQPVGIGWMKDGMWVAITLDNLGEALLTRDEGDAAVRYLYSTINHGPPLYSWCEERGQEPGSESTSGDRQHLWTPVAVGRFVRDLLVMEEDDTLHLARGTARVWLEAGQKVGVKDMRTHFGRVSFGISCDWEERTIGGFIRIEEGTAPHTALHIRLPEGWKINGDTDRNDLAGGWIEADIFRWERLTGEVYFSAGIDCQRRQ
ncbi:MAG: hypothetical protein GYA56_06815 [Geobacteraceae bacterium]|nr:hypothetical protein [Geobacteraceae bacterium]